MPLHFRAVVVWKREVWSGILAKIISKVDPSQWELGQREVCCGQAKGNRREKQDNKLVHIRGSS